MIFNELINNNKNISSIICDYSKILKINEPCNIYSSHIRNMNNDIFIDSVSVEWINHTKDYVIMQSQNTYDDKISLINNFIEKIKSNIFITDKSDSCKYENLNIEGNNYTTNILNKNIFFCNHNNPLWCHTLLYYYIQIYYYYKLKEFIPDLLLIILYNDNNTNYLLKLLNITDYIIIKNNEKIINNGITYCAGNWNCNFTESIINNFYYDIIVKKTLDIYNINITKYPHKLLFLRNQFNIVSPGFLKNRSEIVDLCSKYGYTDIDQTKYKINEIIHIVNNATHIIQETGGSIVHLLWTNNEIKSIIINYSYRYYNTCANNYNDTHVYLKLISNNIFSDITRYKKSKIIYNDIEYIKTLNINHSKNNNTFTNFNELIKVIEENE